MRPYSSQVSLTISWVDNIDSNRHDGPAIVDRSVNFLSLKNEKKIFRNRNYF